MSATQKKNKKTGTFLAAGLVLSVLTVLVVLNSLKKTDQFVLPSLSEKIEVSEETTELPQEKTPPLKSAIPAEEKNVVDTQKTVQETPQTVAEVLETPVQEKPADRQEQELNKKETEEQQLKEIKIAGYLEKAITYTNREDFAAAEEEYRKILSIDPGNHQIYRLLATLEITKEQYKLKKQEKVEFLLKKGTMAFRSHDYMSAKKALEEALVIAPENVYAQQGLAKTNEKLNTAKPNLQEPVKTPETNSQIPQNNSRLASSESRHINELISSGRQAAQSEDFVHAESFYREVILIDPENELAHEGLLDIEEKLADRNIGIEEGQVQQQEQEIESIPEQKKTEELQREEQISSESPIQPLPDPDVHQAENAPPDISELLDKAHEMYTSKEYEQALGLYKDVLFLEPNNKIATDTITMIYRHFEQLEEERILKLEEERRREDQERLHQEELERKAAEKHEKELEKIRLKNEKKQQLAEIKAQKKAEREALKQKQEQERLERQQKILERKQAAEAARVKKKEIDDLLSQGKKEYKEKSYEKAVKTYNRVLVLDKENAKAQKMITIITQKQKDSEKLEEERILKIEKEQRREEQERLLNEEKERKRLQELEWEKAKEQKIQKNSKEPPSIASEKMTASLDEAQLIELSSDEEKKEETIRKLLSDGYVLYKQGSYSDAYDIYSLVLTLDAENALAGSWVAKIQDIMQQLEKERQIETLLTNAQQLFKEGKYCNALKLNKKVLKLDKENSKAIKYVKILKKKCYQPK